MKHFILKMDVVYVRVGISRCLKEELVWAICTFINGSRLLCYLNNYTTKEIKSKAKLSVKQYCIHGYVDLSNVILYAIVH